MGEEQVLKRQVPKNYIHCGHMLPFHVFVIICLRSTGHKRNIHMDIFIEYSIHTKLAHSLRHLQCKPSSQSYLCNVVNKRMHAFLSPNPTA